MADPAMNGDHPGRVGSWVVKQGVVANVIRYRDNPVTAGHGGAIAADGVMAVHAGDVRWPLCRFESAHGQLADPGRQAGMHMQDVRLLAQQPLAAAGLI